ncbi:phage protein NinX family protein [Proteus faecis]|uniref:phage protein NinX family protein n=1 Tax=Proteus faecis TaxID=2050967 RepID=UPI00301BA654
MNRYTELSDFEINKKVADLIGATPFQIGTTEYRRSAVSGCESSIIIRSPHKVGSFDPCNNHTDAMPIIIENKISLLAGGSNFWCARYGEWNILPCPSGIGFIEKAQVINDSPYRAAMELFLLMKDAERETNT